MTRDRRWDIFAGDKKWDEKLGNLFDIRAIPHKMYFNSGFFFQDIYFVFSYCLYFFCPRTKNIIKVMYRSTSFRMRRQIFLFRMLNTGLFPFLRVRDDVLFFFTNLYRIFLLRDVIMNSHIIYPVRNVVFFSVICSNFYPTTHSTTL